MVVISPGSTWLKEMLTVVRWDALSVEGADVEQLMKKHSEYQLQIDRQLSKSKSVKEEGRRLIQEGNTMSTEVRSEKWIQLVALSFQISELQSLFVLFVCFICFCTSPFSQYFSSAQVEECISELEELEVQVQKVWEETRILYEEELEISLLQRELEQAECWLSSYESSLLAEGLGVGVHHPAHFCDLSLEGVKNCEGTGLSGPPDVLISQLQHQRQDFLKSLFRHSITCN